MLVIFKEKNKKGFTLVELLVVMAIIAVLTVLSVANFRNVQTKSRDGQRKSDLGQVQRALEIFFNDHGTYPPAVSGTIDNKAWKTRDTAGGELTDGQTIYMKEMVGDPRSNQQNYCYNSNGVSYQVYATLENGQDLDITGEIHICNEEEYNFGVSSPDVSLNETLP